MNTPNDSPMPSVRIGPIDAIVSGRCHTLRRRHIPSVALRLTVLIAAAGAAACSTIRLPGTAAANSAARALALDSLTGRWNFNVDLGTRQTPGELWLFRRGTELTGTLAPSGTNTLPVRALVLRGDSAHLVVDTPDGPVMFDGVVEGSRASMRGLVTYHQGQRFPMTATKRPAP